MKLIVDTNCLIAALIKNGLSRQLFFITSLELLSPDFTISEIVKHEEELLLKSGITLDEFHDTLSILLSRLTIIPQIVYKSTMKEAGEIMKEIDIHDVPFLALAICLNADGIWSDDAHFAQQKRVRVWTTKELYSQFKSFI